MNYGPLIFLAAFFSLSVSWFGYVLTPQLQLGRLQQTATAPAGDIYPPARLGLAKAGADVYRANGCAACHSQTVRQTGVNFDVVITDAGTNQTALAAALEKIDSTGKSSGIILRGVIKSVADAAEKDLKAAGAKAEVHIMSVGPDISQGWGLRRTVAQDYLFDSPVMPGSQRVGPDLANAGLRPLDANWHLLHLYNPQIAMKGSTMPPHRFLFETRKIVFQPSPEALKLPVGFEPKPGYEVVPKPEARALVAYLQSLRSDAPLFDAPMTAPPAPVAATATNAPPK